MDLDPQWRSHTAWASAFLLFGGVFLHFFLFALIGFWFCLTWIHLCFKPSLACHNIFFFGLYFAEPQLFVAWISSSTTANSSLWNLTNDNTVATLNSVCPLHCFTHCHPLSTFCKRHQIHTHTHTHTRTHTHRQTHEHTLQHSTFI